MKARHEVVQIPLDEEGRSEPYAVDERKFRLLQQRPAFAEKARVGLDKDRLYRCIRLLRDQREAALERVDAFPARARSFRKDQQLPAGTKLAGAFPDEVRGRNPANRALPPRNGFPKSSALAVQTTLRSREITSTASRRLG